MLRARKLPDPEGTLDYPAQMKHWLERHDASLDERDPITQMVRGTWDGGRHDP